MNPFVFSRPTRLYFGKDQVKNLPEILREYGSNVLFAYGGGSIKRNGIYRQLTELLGDFQITELSGIEPNPKIESVREGIRLCKENHVDVILAVGGGSTIDCSKAVAAGVKYEGDVWNLITNSVPVKDALPVVTVLTVSATGSEMNGNAVISDMTNNLKMCLKSELVIPRASICDPTYLYTLPAKHTAAGTADIISHVIEQYFQKYDGAFLSDRMCEDVIKTCVHYCPIALEDPENYEARANLMWASTLGLNGILSCGKGGGWSCHPIEHELSAFYDVTHGEGLAIVTPAWMRHILSPETLDRFYTFAVNVWDIPESEDRIAVANKGIDALEAFFKSINIPMTLGQVGINDEKLHEMAVDAVRLNNLEQSAYVGLNVEDVEEILRQCL